MAAIPLLGVALVPNELDTDRSLLNRSEAFMLRYSLLLAALVGWAPLAFAQVCCPSGCVQDRNKCVTTGPSPVSCHRVACPAPPPPRATDRHPSGPPLSRPILPVSRSSGMCCDPTRRPGGSYSQTCRDYEMRCHMENQLLATCKDRRGRDVRTALPNVSTCKNIENENGQMKCRKRAKRPPAACI